MWLFIERFWWRHGCYNKTNQRSTSRRRWWLLQGLGKRSCWSGSKTHSWHCWLCQRQFGCGQKSHWHERRRYAIAGEAFSAIGRNRAAVQPPWSGRKSFVKVFRAVYNFSCVFNMCACVFLNVFYQRGGEGKIRKHRLICRVPCHSG